MNSSAITITALRTRCVLVPMKPPHRTASGDVSVSPLVLIDVTRSDGAVGHAIVFTYTPAALKPTADFLNGIEPLVLGQSADAATQWHALQARFRLLGQQGLVGMALAGLDMALWDAHARAMDCALHTLLGFAAKAVPCYASIGYEGEAGSAKAAEAWATRGFRGIKAKIGYPTLAEDLAVIRAMRSATGPSMAIMVDYNQSLDPQEAAARLRSLDGEDLVWVEEPVAAHDWQALARLSEHTKTPLQAGENYWGPQDFAHALSAGATSAWMPDAMKGGGVTGWLQIAALAAAHRIRVSSHLWPEVSAQLLCATPTAHWLEWADWWDVVLQEPLALQDGCSDVRGVIGSGVAFNESAIAKLLA